MGPKELVSNIKLRATNWLMGTKKTNDQQPLSEVVVSGETRKDQQPNITTAESEVEVVMKRIAKGQREQILEEDRQGSYRADTFDLYKDALSLDR